MGLCDLCRGACCETFVLALGDNVPEDQREFFAAWGVGHEAPGGFALVIPQRCQHLTKDGRCGTYAERPRVCRTFEEGGEKCLQKIARLRPGLVK